MQPLVSEESFESYSRYRRENHLNPDRIRESVGIFKRFLEQGVIREPGFESTVWKMTDEVKNYRIDFRLDGRTFRAGAGSWCGLDRAAFVKCMKAYTLYSMGSSGLGSIREAVKELKALAGMGQEAAMSFMPCYSTIEFFRELPGASETRDQVVEAMEENRLAEVWNRQESRKLSDFRTYLRFDRALDDFWSTVEEKKKTLYFPVYLWWRLTAVLPLRPTEFLLIPAGCLRKEDGGWLLSVRRTLKKKRKGRCHYSVDKDYEICEYTIPDSLAEKISEYQTAVATLRKPENQALFIPGDESESWYLTYGQFRYRLDRLVSCEMGLPDISIHPGDTRHLAMINLILSGGSPTVCRELAGHESIDISSNYYANLSSVIETTVYEFCRAGQQDIILDGRLFFPVTAPEKRRKVTGGWCTGRAVLSGDINDCLKNYQGIGRFGECRDCMLFYPESPGIRIKIREEAKKSVDFAGEFLIQMIETVRKGNGNEESILSAMARIRKAANDYAGILYRQQMGDR